MHSRRTMRGRHRLAAAEIGDHSRRHPRVVITAGLQHGRKLGGGTAGSAGALPIKDPGYRVSLTTRRSHIGAGPRLTGPSCF
jgi:hypothetical protein